MDLTTPCAGLDAATALALGLVNRVVPGDAFEREAAEFAGRLASSPTAARLRNRVRLKGRLWARAAEAGR